MAKRKRITTPVGRARFPWLCQPDTKFDPEGVFRVQLLLDPEENEDFLKRLDAMADEAFEDAKEDLKEKRPQDVDKVRRKDPYEYDYDDEGNKTGKVYVKFKMNHIITTDSGKIELEPDLFDAKGNIIDKDDFNVTGGSKIRINFTPRKYYMASTKLAGVSLQLNAVQIIELAQAGGDPEFYGFGEEEDGFDVEEHGGNSGDFETFEEGDDEFDVSEEDF